MSSIPLSRRSYASASSASRRGGAARVGIVIGQLTHGGAERQCLELARGLRSGGDFEPVVFCTSQATEPYGRLLTECGIEWFAAPAGRRRGFGKLRWLTRSVRNSRCSLLYGMLHTGNVYAGFAARLLRMPFVASIRLAAKPPALFRLASAVAGRTAVAVVANSPSAGRFLETDLRIRHSWVVVIPNAVREVETNLRARAETRRQLGIPSDAVVVGTVANLKAQKRAGFFIDACGHVLDRWPQVRPNHPCPHFVWLGDGPERQAVDRGLGRIPDGLRARIHFPGASLKIDGYLSAFDLFVLTSAYEGMPNALLEAMSAGLPCVATDVPGTCDVLNAANGIGVLAEANDPRRFAEALLEMLRDFERMKTMGKQARQYVRKHHSLEEMTRQYCSLFREALASG